MTVLESRFTPSSAGGDADSSFVTFGVDVSQAPVFLSAAVVDSRGFARLMLALGDVVRLKEVRREVDHSAYQEWVRGEYLKELSAEQAQAAKESPVLLARRESESQAVAEASERARQLMPEGDVFAQERRAFWQWLYDHNRAAWLVLDPIVSVQPDAVFFEAFSQDESVYARVRLPMEGLDLERPIQPGTTNIDYSVALEREFARTRTYRPLQLTVGADAVGMSTDVSSITERKIDLPDTWVRGLVEVQSALALAPVEIDLSASFVADIVSRLQAERERTGPRALVFRLIPGEPVTIEIQPWGEIVTDRSAIYEGDRRRDIKVWGRRRLSVLMGVLSHSDRVSVRLIDSGMPSFWSVSIGDLTLTVGLSGWSSQDWAGRARFSALVPASVASDSQVEEAAHLLREQHRMSADEVATALNVAPAVGRAALQRLCLIGQAMFDPDSGCYRWRALFPNLDLAQSNEAGREERKGVELAQVGAVEVRFDGIVDGGTRRVVAAVRDGSSAREAIIETDVDGRVEYAQCDCSHFRYHKLRQGPCRHIVATTIVDPVS